MNFRQVLISIVPIALGSGLVSAVATALINTNGSWGIHQSDIRQKNIELVFKVHEDDDAQGMPEKAAAYAAMMAEGDLIPTSLACGLVGFSLYDGKKDETKAPLAVIENVRAAVAPEFLARNFAGPPCDVEQFGHVNPAMEKGKTSDIQAASKTAFACPGGILYTQFGAGQQSAFGITLRDSLNKAIAGKSVTAPQIIEKYTSDSIVVRYFFPSVEDEARRWQLLIEMVTGGKFDVKYAYIPGYETAIGEKNSHTFELWWPAGIDVPSGALQEVHCEPAITG